MTHLQTLGVYVQWPHVEHSSSLVSAIIHSSYPSNPSAWPNSDSVYWDFHWQIPLPNVASHVDESVQVSFLWKLFEFLAPSGTFTRMLLWRWCILCLVSFAVFWVLSFLIKTACIILCIQCCCICQCHRLWSAYLSYLVPMPCWNSWSCPNFSQLSNLKFLWLPLFMSVSYCSQPEPFNPMAVLCAPCGNLEKWYKLVARAVQWYCLA